MIDRLRRPLPLAVLLFVVAAAVRLLFVTATPDGAGPHSPLYKGDAAVWLGYAGAIQRGEPFQLELGLPFRPPGTAWLVAALWDGTAEGLGRLRIAWAILGALLAPLTFAAARRAGTGVAAVAGGLVAVASGPILLSAAPNSEVPFALLAVAGLGLLPRLRERWRPVEVVAWGLLQGTACLFRAEHVLVAALGLLWLWRGWRRPAEGAAVPWSRVLARSGVLVALAIAPTVPWHVSAFADVARYDTEERPPVPPRTLPWSADAVEFLESLPGFVRAATQRFVEATVRYRGGDSVGTAELAVIDEAFGYRPRALPRVFFIALYGPLNFALANGPGADGGFSRRALEAPPLLEGGADRYPPDWLASLPGADQLSLDYPPHLQLVVDGYRIGASWMLTHPLDFVRLAMRKLALAWGGVAHGLGGRALPLGASGVRRPVDLTVPEGPLATAWRVAWLVLVLVGLWRARRRSMVVPWLTWMAGGFFTTVAFYGYARQGATLLPAFAVMIGFALEPLWRGRERGAARAGLAVLGLVVVVEIVRWFAPPTIYVDGRASGAVEPWPPLQYASRQIEVR